MAHVALHKIPKILRFVPQTMAANMNQQSPILTEDAIYIDEITAMLRNLLRQVIKAREPEVLPIIDTPEAAATIPAHLVEHALQAIGIWLQLMNIAEENAAIRNRRTLEKQAGPDEVGGSLSHASIG